MIGIYKITNPKGKVYVGQSIDLEIRINGYKKIHGCKNQIKLKRSLKKYGPENHNFQIIMTCKEERLNKWERYWQEYYDVIGCNGLNLKLTYTNNKSGKLSETTKKKISESLKNCGRVYGPVLEETKEKRRITRLLNTNTFKKKKFKFRSGIDTKFKKGHSLNSKKVINIETGEIYNSVKICSELNNINYSTLMGKLNKNKVNHKNNTPFEYLEEYLNNNDFAVS